MGMNCPFCKNEVKTEHEMISGCKVCAEDWMVNERVDHPVG